MKTTNLLFCIMVFITGCSQLQNNSTESEQEIVNTDLAMSELATKDGFLISLYKYADENFVKLNEGSFPVVGKQAFKEFSRGRSGPKTLTWKPVKAEVAESGELGYTWGNWKFALPDTTVYGNYFIVWKKQRDGKWKMLLDGGNGTPAPVNSIE